jgi:hypothetical protein
MSENIKASISRHIIFSDNVKNSKSSLDKIKLDNIKTFYNILIQCLISIDSYHNLKGYLIKGMNFRNFLYVENSEYNATKTTEYYKYLIDGKTYYLGSCEYNVLIFSHSNNCNDLNILTPEYLKSRLLQKLISENPCNTSYSSVEAFVFDKIYCNIEDINERKNLSRNYEFEEHKKIEKGLYRLDILLNDYLCFLKDMLQLYNTEQESKNFQDFTVLHNKIKSKIEILHKLVENNEVIVESVVDLLQQEKILVKDILDICVEQFPDILFTQENFDTDKIRTVLNDIAF